MTRVTALVLLLAGAFGTSTVLPAAAAAPSSEGVAASGLTRCAGEVTVTNVKIARMIATDIQISGHMTCRKAKATIRAFFVKKLGDLSERCAERAESPPYKGCRVGPFTCRGSASLLTAQGCAAEGTRITFRERDIALG